MSTRSLPLVLTAAVLATTSASGAQAASVAASGTWSGTYTLPRGAEAVPIAVTFAGNRTTVALDYGHAQSQTVRSTQHGRRVTFSLPGRPSPVSFRGTVGAAAITGPVSQGKLDGRFRLHRGGGAIPRLLGLFADGLTTVHYADNPFVPRPQLVDVSSGDTHGLAQAGSGFTVGPRIGDTTGLGSLGVDQAALTWMGSHARLSVRQFEVRFPSGGATLAGTLTLPAGTGPFTAAALVHGSGPRPRGDFQPFVAFLATQGIASLVYDKRGIGESGGSYPGERATAATIDVLARDAAAAARFLARQREIDAHRVGLMGDSQGGWIISLAASREPAVHWGLQLVGPTVTVDESDTWGSLAGQGATPPAAPFAELEQRVRAAGPGGFDPAPYLRQVGIPMLWIYGDDDRNIPTALCVDKLQELRAGHDFTWVVLHTTHTLLDLPSGMNADIPRSRGFAVGLFSTMNEWLRAHSLAR